MDFIDGLPRSKQGHDSIWVVVDRLTKSAHFIPVKAKRTASYLAKLYVKEVIRLHGVPSAIVCDRDPLFTSGFWRSLQAALGTKLNISSAYHPQSDGQTERVNKILEDLLRSCILDFGGSWEDHLYLVEFSYNNSFQSSIGMAPFEALYGRPCRSPACWLETGDKLVLGPDTVREASEKVEIIRRRMKEAQDRQKSYADKRRKDLEFSVGDHVFVKVTPLKGVMRFSKTGKLAPRFIGPYPIMERIGKLAYRVALPEHLSSVHNVFHVSHLRKCLRDSEEVIEPKQLQQLGIAPNMTYTREPIRIIASETKKLRSKVVPLVKVQWSSNPKDCTWETQESMQRHYPELFGARVRYVLFFLKFKSTNKVTDIALT